MKYFIKCPLCGKEKEKKLLYIKGDEVHLTSGKRPCEACYELDDFRICEFCGSTTFIHDLTCRVCGAKAVLL